MLFRKKKITIDLCYDSGNRKYVALIRGWHKYPVRGCSRDLHMDCLLWADDWKRKHEAAFPNEKVHIIDDHHELSAVL